MAELQLVWNWQPALYLFLGGMGAGAFVMATILFTRDKQTHKKTITMTLWASALSLIIGLILLLTELTFPLRGLILWESFSNLSSWMALGAWIVFVALIVFVVAAILMTDRFYALIGQKDKPAEALLMMRNVFVYLGAICGIGVAVYTGILLLAAESIPLWNTPLLPALFTVSALATGAALVEILMLVNAKKDAITGTTRSTEASAAGVTRATAATGATSATATEATGTTPAFFGRLVLVLVLVELVVAISFIAVMSTGNGLASPAFEAAQQSAALFISGTLAPVFWALYVGCGLIIPLVVAFLALRKPKKNGEPPHSSKLTLVGALGALVGGCALRFIILLAGLHADYLGDTIMKIIS